MRELRLSQLSVGAVAAVVVVFVGLGLASAGVAAQSEQPAWADSMYENASQMVPAYNGQITDRDLGPASGQLKAERVNLVATDETTGETATVSFRLTDQLEIEDLSKGPRDDATIKMTTSRATVEQISASETPGNAFQAAIKSDRIKISGLTWSNTVKWAVINAVRGVLNVLG